MKIKPTKYEDVHKETTEHREIKTIYNGISTHGNSTQIVVCPFCECETEVFIWSYNGCGKRCTNDNCKAMMARRNAFKRDMK